VLKECAQAERVHNESMSNHSPHMPVEVPYPDAEFSHVPESPLILQDEDNTIRAYPMANTRQQQKVRTITQDYLFHMMDIPGHTKPFSNQQAASCKYPLQFLCNFAAAVLDDETGDLLEYQHLLRHPKYRDTWSKSFGMEIHRLATTTEMIALMSKDMIPHNRCKDITYGQIICNYRSEKKDPYRTHITMGGNLINYLDDCGTPTADLLTVKLMFNSVISTPNTKFMTINIKDFYLMTPMEQYEYFHIKIELFPPDIIEEYGLRNKVDADGNVFCEVRQGMYGLLQAGIIAQDLLTKQLNKAGYRQSKITPGY
jgi:hypothetical protein